MILDDKDNNYDRFSITGPSILGSVNISDHNSISLIGDRIQTINDYSAGLGFAITNKDILAQYTTTLDSQRVALSSISEIGTRISLEGSKIASVLNRTVLPISSVVAEIGLASANATKLHGVGSINSKTLELAQGVSTLALKTIQEQQSVFTKGLEIVANSGVLKFADEISPSLRVVSAGVSEMMRSLPTFPVATEVLFPSLDITRTTTARASKEEISQHQKDLDGLLNKIDPALVEFRKGVWKAFNDKSNDYIGQASSSMRRLVDNLLRALAPQEKVTETEFFKTSPKAKDEKGRPTRKAKVLYLMDWDKNKAEHLMRITNGFLETYDNLSAWDHAPIDKHGFVHGTLIAIEGQLISILNANK